ncbi:MAG: hypothetical protein COA50_12635 [Flavobacteriaceae bacterium]|nr:MAG: hypothetical protein COA50_12635 [Flavobacteriaceae bacterium]
MKSIFDAAAYTEILNRFDTLTSDSKGNWGKMSVGQMAWHCQGPIAVSMGKTSIKKPSFFVGLLMKSFKKSLYNDKQWKQGIPTAKQYIATFDKEFSTEKEKLIVLIKELHKENEKAPWITHPVFGNFTAEQWGQLNYKHLDHHLRQFGV